MRPRYLDLLTRNIDRDTVRILTGVRRAGKSSVLRLYRDHLRASGVSESEIITVNFEDMRNRHLRDAQTFHEYVVKAYDDGARFLHVDEIQELDTWAQVINSLRVATDLEICVTGSNASMFSDEAATYIAGRYVTIEVWPLSLAEFRTFKGLDDEPVDESYSAWITAGGFPRVVLTQDGDLHAGMVRDIFDSIFARDIVLRGQIRDAAAFLRVARFVFASIGSPINAHKIHTRLKANGIKLSAPTVENYLRLMEQANLIFPVRRQDTRGGQWLQGGAKYYGVDLSLRDALLGTGSAGEGHDLENQIYIELRRRGYRVVVGANGGKEIDFVAAGEGRTHFIQVAFSAMDEGTRARELAAFDGLAAGASCILITLDRIFYSTGHVRRINGADFLAGLVDLPH